MDRVSKTPAGTSAQTRPASVLAVLFMAALSLSAGEPTVVRPFTIHWGEQKFTDVSGVGVVGRFLVVCNDESRHSVHVLDLRNGEYTYLGHVQLTAEDEELDLEGIACDKDVVYVIGSHSRNKKNDRQRAREKVFRFRLGPDVKPGADGRIKADVAVTSLRDVIVKHPSLEPASHKKPKEGGVDVEGIAVRDGWLYAGFRGPLEHSDALVLKFRFEDPTGAQLLPVDLGGLGIRDLTRVADGFLVLAGPMDSAAGPYQLHHWNGQGGPAGKTRRLCTIPVRDSAKVEGVAVLREDSDAYEFLVLHDGPEGGDPKHFHVKR